MYVFAFFRFQIKNSIILDTIDANFIINKYHCKLGKDDCFAWIFTMARSILKYLTASAIHALDDKLNANSSSYSCFFSFSAGFGVGERAGSWRKKLKASFRRLFFLWSYSFPFFQNVFLS